MPDPETTQNARIGHNHIDLSAQFPRLPFRQQLLTRLPFWHPPTRSRANHPTPTRV
jgi:hypothetical protein